MNTEAERKVMRDGLVKISDIVSELLADSFDRHEDVLVLSSLHSEIWKIRIALGVDPGEVLADVPAAETAVSS